MADAPVDASATDAETRPRILIADDEPEILRVFEMVLEPEGYEIFTAKDGLEAKALFEKHHFDVVLTDLTMPGLDGVDLLRAIRKVDLDVPVVFITAAPSLESAIRAVEFGALRYLIKPVRTQEILKVVREALKLHELARLKREALEVVGSHATQAGDPAGLEVSFETALEELYLLYQPIVRYSEKRVFGYEALVRSGARALPDPGSLLDAAERLGRLRDVGRSIRGQAADPFDGTENTEPLLFVNLHSEDLEDPDLLLKTAPLSGFANRTVLEITERASLDGVKDVREKVASLRSMGFRIAVDDLGAGYAGLTSFSLLEPEVVKLDMALVRGVDESATKRKVVGSFKRLCDEMGILTVCEGIETEGERDVLVDLGCDLLQGYLFSKPGPAFPKPRF